jgi:hypothetical protein
MCLNLGFLNIPLLMERNGDFSSRVKQEIQNEITKKLPVNSLCSMSVIEHI